MKTCGLGLILGVTAAMALALHPAAGGRASSGPGQTLPVTWSAPSAAAKGAAGTTVGLEITARIDEGWHLYSLTQPPPPDPTVIEVPDGQAFQLDGTIEAPAPDTGFDEAQDAATEYYTESVTFRIPITTKPGTGPGDYTVRVTARWQACNGSLCLRPQVATLDVPVQISDQRH